MITAFLVYGVVLAAGDVPPESAPAEQVAAEEEATETVEISDEQLRRGQIVFVNNCAACHGDNGEGGVGPTLDGNSEVADSEYIIDMVLHGGSFMTPFRNELNDEQIADVTTYIRNAWSNSEGLVTPEEVAAQR